METNFSLIERLVWKYAGERVMAEYRFHPAREWRFDFAIPERHVAIEVEGGAFIGRAACPDGRIFARHGEVQRGCCRRLARLTCLAVRTAFDRHLAIDRESM